MMRSRWVIALTVVLAIDSLTSAQPPPPPTRRPVRPPISKPAAPDARRAPRPVRAPQSQESPESAPASSEASEESSPTSRPAYPPRPDIASRPAREPQVVEFEIASAEDEPWGRIVIELYPERTPITIRTFVQYVNSGFYDGTIFHRVIPQFIIQGGGLTSLTDKKTEGLAEPIRNESRRGTLKNVRGTIAMARKQDPHSAVAQFFINLANNEQLDYPRAGAYGYCVFGKVVEGMDVVDRIAEVPTKVSAAAQRRFERYNQEGRPVEKPEQSEPLSPPVLKHARMLDPSEFPASVTSGPAGRRAQHQAEQEAAASAPAPQAEEQATEEPTSEPAVEPEAATGSNQEIQPEDATQSEEGDNNHAQPKSPEKRGFTPKTQR
jgi:cyclophilin family peptidyl-prolyl cis-trans isomerase